MKPERWQQVKEIFTAALEVSPDKRAAFLSEVSADSDEVRRDVEILLHSFESGYLEEPIVDKIAEQIVENQLTAGQKIKHYEIRKKIGAGGMGEVYLAQDTQLQRPVAIKFLLAGMAFNKQGEKRLLREAQSAAVLNHPNICTIYEIGTSENRSFIVMEYIEGETLEALIKRKLLSISESLSIALSIADALAEAHLRGIVHRDIKPSNVIISSRGQIKVLDFSLAKKLFSEADATTQSLLSQAGIIAGTVAYMSPEQARGKAIDARSDIWSLGVVLYEMLTGRLPFAGETKSDIIAAILTKDFPKINETDKKLLPEINQIIDKSLQKERNDRFANAQDFHSQLTLLQSKINSAPTTENESVISTIPTKVAYSANFDANSTLENEGATFSEMLRATKESGFRQKLKVAKPFRWIALMVIGAIITSLVGWRVYQNYSKDVRPFSDSSRGNLQITSLFSAKRKPNGAITDVSFSPDGKLIAFLLAGDGISDIYIKQTDSGEPIKITDGKWINQTPVWSPDGQRIAFVSNRDDKNGIWTISYLGRTPILQTPLELNRLSYQLRKWSNDGKRIFFETSGKLRTIELDSGQISEIKLPEVEISGSFSVSKDEKMIAYIVIENTKEQIWIQSLETGEARAISKNNHHNWSPVFFPDNQRIAYSSNQNGNFQIYVADLKGTTPSQITFGDVNSNIPVISPDGFKMVYVSESDEANIFLYDLKSNRETQQTANIKLQLFPNVSPNNETIVFQTTDESAKIYSSPLKIKTLGSENEPNQIVQYGGWAKWSPKGDSVAFLRLSGLETNIWKIELAGQKEKQLTFDGKITVEGQTISPYNLMSTPFSWSPDGSKIVYSSKQSGAYNLWTVDENGSNPQMLTDNNDKKLKFNSPIWSLDGNQIAFTYRLQIEANKFQYGVSSLLNGETKNIFQSDSQIRLLNWSQSGTEVLLAVKNQEDVDLIKVNSNGKPEVLVKMKGAYLHGICLSLDTKKIAFSARRNGVDNIFVYSLDGQESQLTSNLDNTLYYSGLTWSPDGNQLFYSKQSGGMQISMISDSK